MVHRDDEPFGHLETQVVGHLVSARVGHWGTQTLGKSDTQNSDTVLKEKRHLLGLTGDTAWKSVFARSFEFVPLIL